MHSVAEVYALNDCERTVDKLSNLIRIKTISDPLQKMKTNEQQASKIKTLLDDNYTILANAPSPILLAKKGRGRPITLWLAHYDVVPPGPGWSRDPFNPTITDDKIYGRGAADDKSNVAAIDSTLHDFEPPNGTILIAFTGDEEVGGASSEWLYEYLANRGLKPDYLINGDGSLSRIIIRRRAGFTLTLSVEERLERIKGELREFEARAKLARSTMHSAYFIPGVDTHPLVALSLKLRDNDLYAVSLEGDWVKNNVIPGRALLRAVKLGGRDDIVVDVGLTAAIRALLPLSRAPIPTERYSDYGVNINPNVYYKENNIHVFKIDIRAMTTNRFLIEEIVRDILEENLEYHGIKYDFRIRGGKGYLYTDRNSRIVREATSINSQLGLPSEPVEAGGASDSRYFSPRGIESIDYGPLGANIHGPDEYVYISHLCKAVRFYRALAMRLHSG